MKTLLALFVLVTLGACAGLSTRDPLVVDVAGIEPLPGEGMELRLQIAIRIQNPNDTAIEYRGTALDLSLNGRRAASGVSDEIGTVPRYGETVIHVPVTISALNMARQVLGFMDASATDEISYEVSGKLEGGLFGTRRFRDEGTFMLPTSARSL